MFALGARATVLGENHFGLRALHFLWRSSLVQVFEEKQGMETITSHVYGLLGKTNFHYESVVGWFLWALVVLVGSSQVLELFYLMCFGF